MTYPFGDALAPDQFDEHTIVFLMRPSDAPEFSDVELERLQVEHLTYLRELTRRGVLLVNGPLADPTDGRLRGISIYGVPLDDALEAARADPMVCAHRLEIHGARWLTTQDTVSFGGPVQAP